MSVHVISKKSVHLLGALGSLREHMYTWTRGGLKSLPTSPRGSSYNMYLGHALDINYSIWFIRVQTNNTHVLNPPHYPQQNTLPPPYITSTVYCIYQGSVHFGYLP